MVIYPWQRTKHGQECLTVLVQLTAVSHFLSQPPFSTRPAEHPPMLTVVAATFLGYTANNPNEK